MRLRLSDPDGGRMNVSADVPDLPSVMHDFAKLGISVTRIDSDQGAELAALLDRDLDLQIRQPFDALTTRANVRPTRAVVCLTHGRATLSASEYLAQSRQPARGWKCPSCGGPALLEASAGGSDAG